MKQLDNRRYDSIISDIMQGYTDKLSLPERLAMTYLANKIYQDFTITEYKKK